MWGGAFQADTLSAIVLFTEIHICSLNHGLSVTYCSFLLVIVHRGLRFSNEKCAKKCGKDTARLTAALIRSTGKPGRHSDEDALFVIIG